MKTLILIYDSYAEFEVNIVGLFMKGKGEVLMVSPNDTLDFVTGEGQFRTVPHITLSDVHVEDYDLLVIPGGNPVPLLTNGPVLDLIRDFAHNDKLLAAICSGPVLLSAAGVLEGKKYTTSYKPDEEESKGHFNWVNWTNEDVEVESRVITAKGNAYVEFAIAIYKTLGLFGNHKDEEETYTYFKNLK